ncbi:hypothetical protein B0H16DRAFT_1604568 [Mycena metata]|uniref:Uncharacterized protein n=1 Tax=Mycena metata TaxID=1033252 RepID=A0AAD7HIE1_9AGAR|nr:hypothetical protein B0H16DRAFT_1604568 [Mycena metata]
MMPSIASKSVSRWNCGMLSQCARLTRDRLDAKLLFRELVSYPLVERIAGWMMLSIASVSRWVSCSVSSASSMEGVSSTSSCWLWRLKRGVGSGEGAGENDTRLEPFGNGGWGDGCSDSPGVPEPERMLRLDTFLRSELNNLLLRTSGEGKNEWSPGSRIAELVVSSMVRLLCDLDERWRKRPEKLSGCSDENECLGGMKKRPFFSGGDGGSWGSNCSSQGAMSTSCEGGKSSSGSS